MNTIKLTVQEATLLKYLMKGSAFNSDKLDLTKSWEEQELENGDAYYDIVDLDAYNEAISANSGANAVISNLKKLGIIDLFDDDAPDGSPMTWLIIEKENFELIKTLDLNVQSELKEVKAEEVKKEPKKEETKKATTAKAKKEDPKEPKKEVKKTEPKEPKKEDPKSEVKKTEPKAEKKTTAKKTATKTKTVETKKEPKTTKAVEPKKETKEVKVEPTKKEETKPTASKTRKPCNFIDFTLQDGMTVEEGIKNLTKNHCKNRLMKYARRYGMYWKSDDDQFINWKNAVEAIKDRMNGVKCTITELPKIDKGTKPTLDIRFAQGADVNLELEKLSFYYSEGRIMSVAKQLGITFKEDSNAWENAKKAIKEWVANDYFPVIMNG